MNTESENSIDLEQLLRTKSWEQLTDAERTEVLKNCSGEEEYTRMYAMTHRLMAERGIQSEELKPSEQLRKHLLYAFAEEQRKRRAAWWSSLWYGLSDKLRFDIPIVRIAVAAILLLAGVFGVMKLMEKENVPQMVKNQPVDATQPLSPQQSGPENNVAVKPENGVPLQNVDPDSVLISDEIVNAPQNVAVDPVLNPVAVVQDTAPQYITAFTNNGQPLIVDSNALVLPTAAFNATNVFCCGTSNGAITTFSNGGTSYQWTSTVNLTVNGLPSRARSLANDAAVLDVFFAVK